MPVFGTSANFDKVLADLARRDVERGGELDIADVIAAEVDVHEPGDEFVRRGVLVVLDALDERVGAVADADDRDADTVVPTRRAAVAGCHWFLSPAGTGGTEPLGEDLDDQFVGAAAALGGAGGELLLERRRHAQQHVALSLRRGAFAPARLERNGEAGGEDADCDVVEAAPRPCDFGGQALLQLARHSDEDVYSASTQVLAMIAAAPAKPARPC